MGKESYNTGSIFVKDLYTYMSQIQQKNKILEANKWALVQVKTILLWLTFYPCKFPKSKILYRWVLYLEIFSSPLNLNFHSCKVTYSGETGKEPLSSPAGDSQKEHYWAPLSSACWQSSAGYAEKQLFCCKWPSPLHLIPSAMLILPCTLKASSV